MANNAQTANWTVEKILRKRIRSNKVQYFVKWFGLPGDFDSWVDEQKCNEKLIHDYNMATTEEFPVEKVLDKRIRGGKVSIFFFIVFFLHFDYFVVFYIFLNFNRFLGRI